MKNVLAFAAATGMVLGASLLTASPSFAKAHDQGFGNGTAGPQTAGKVDEGVTNRGGGGSGSTYGQREGGVRDQAQSGTRDNSDRARDQNDAGHPSNK